MIAATRFDANSFFTSTDTTNTQIKDDLNKTLYIECFADIKYFQMSGVDLPNKFEAALSNTTLQDNEINTAMADKTTSVLSWPQR